MGFGISIGGLSISSKGVQIGGPGGGLNLSFGRGHHRHMGHHRPMFGFGRPPMFGQAMNPAQMAQMQQNNRLIGSAYDLADGFIDDPRTAATMNSNPQNAFIASTMAARIQAQQMGGFGGMNNGMGFNCFG